MSLEGRENDLKDVDLCYKGMGIPFDSSPDEVEKAYKSLTEKFNKDLLSSDPAKRIKAKEDAEFVGTLYEKIRNSVNYQRRLRERSYAPDEAGSTQRRTIEKRGPVVIQKICPSCNNLINKALKICPICKKRLYSSIFEKIWVENFTSKNILITVSILSCLVLITLIAIYFGDILRFINQLQK